VLANLIADIEAKMSHGAQAQRHAIWLRFELRAVCGAVNAGLRQSLPQIDCGAILNL
jgi:hypothetical protein